MTWVIAERSVLHAFIAADMRVTWPSGQHHDCLQKIHAVAPGVIVGFAGSVVLGLEVVEKMRQQWRKHLHTARSIYSRYPRLLRWCQKTRPQDTAEFITLSRRPIRAFGGRTWEYGIHTFKPPGYEAREVKWNEQRTIGSGNDHAALVKNFRFVRDPELEFRFHDRPDLFGGRVAFELFQFLSNQDVRTVSKWFIYGTFMSKGHLIKPHIDTHIDKHVVVVAQPPVIIKDLLTYRAFAAQHGLQAEAALA